MMKTLLIVAGLLFSTLAYSQQINTKAVALDGYALVTYFTKNQAIQVTAKLSVELNGIYYHFSSVESKEMFEKNPAQYMPECGGFCATGVATASAKFPVDPENFTVTDGKLYLFYNGPYQGSHFDGKEPWSKDETALIKKAEANWSTIKNN